MAKNVIIIGAGGHAKVIADIVLCSGDNLIGFLDDDEGKQDKIAYKDYKVIGRIADFRKHEDAYFIIAIGDNNVRAKIADWLDAKIYTAIHPKAVISDTVKIGEGTTIMAGTVINTDTKIGKHCIINTSCSIDHDNIIDDFAHISPGAHLAGKAYIGRFSWICAGATIINNINISNDVIIGAGATVIDDINKPGTYVGTPAKRIK